MERNYAAPKRSGSTVPFAPRRDDLRPGLVLVFVGLLLLQVWALYLYVPSPSAGPAIPHADKVVHAAIFAVPAAVGVLARLRPWLVALALVVHAPVSEIVQHRWLSGRAGDPWDVLADVVGIAVGLGFGLVVARRGD